MLCLIVLKLYTRLYDPIPQVKFEIGHFGFQNGRLVAIFVPNFVISSLAIEAAILSGSNLFLISRYLG